MPTVPKINDMLARNLAIGQDFQLNCSVLYDSGVRFEIKWEVPHPRGIDVMAKL